MRPRPTSGPTRRSRRPLVIITLVAITLVTVDSVGGGALDPVRNVASDIFSPVGSALGWVATPFGNAWAGITGYDEVVEENEELRREVAGLRSDLATRANDSEQLARLQAEVGIEIQDEIPSQIARVASGPRNNFTDHRFEIDKGSSSGLEVGMPVTAGKGLVGRLVRVATNRSVVQLATDPSFIIGVRIGETQDMGVGHGSGPGNPFVVDRGIELEDTVEVGDAVLSSGLERAVMPPDIPVGRVAEVQPDEAARSLILRVEYFAELSQLDVVTVLEWVPSP